MLTIINLAAPFFALILAGYVAARAFKLPEEGLAWLNILIVYFALPALIFLTVSATPFEKLVEWPFVLATSLGTSAAFLLPFAVFVLMLRVPATLAAIQGTSASFGNVGYMGLPLAVAFFGEKAAVPAALIFCFDCALQFVLTPLLVTLGRRNEEEGVRLAPALLRALKAIVIHPFIIATFAGVAGSALALKFPIIIENYLQMMSRAAGPSALFALGVMLGLRRFSNIGGEFPSIILVKLVLHPILAYNMLILLGPFDPLWVNVAVMMAALPTATNAFVLASQYRSYIEGASNAILVTTLISAVTLPLIVYAAKQGWLS